MNKKRIGIIGTGAFGIALAKLCYQNQMDVTCYTKIQEECDTILKERENKMVLPNIKIPLDIKVTTDLEKTINNSDVIILVLPVKYLRGIIKKIASFNIRNKTFFIASKGIEEETGLLLNDIFSTYIKANNFGVISGPSFAIDIVKENKFGFTIATRNNKMYKLAQEIFENKYCYLELSNDVIGVLLCGSLKNVFAIIFGLINGLNFTDTTKSFFFTMAISELKQIIMVLGGKKDTILTLAGIGDMYLTCNSLQSRNYEFGYLLANDKDKANNYLESHTVEGVMTLKSVQTLLKKRKIDTPLIETIYNIVFHNSDPNTTLMDLNTLL